MQTGFLTQNNYYKEDKYSDSRIRVEYVAKYIENSHITEDKEVLKNCDAIIFSSRFFAEDIELIERFKDTKKVLIMDLSDPVWWNCDKDDTWFKNDVIKNLDLIVCPTKLLVKMYRKHYGIRNVTCIPDRMELEKYNRVKIHEKKDHIKLIWQGYIWNLEELYPFIKEIVEIGAFHKRLYGSLLELLIVSDQKPDNAFFEKFSNLKISYKKWDSDKILEYILESDIALNCRPDTEKFNYKSNNKTITSWALGVPCVESKNFKKLLKIYVEDAERRKLEGIKCRLKVEKYWDSRISAKQYQKIILFQVYKKYFLTHNLIIGFRKNIKKIKYYLINIKPILASSIIISFEYTKRNKVVFDLLILLIENQNKSKNKFINNSSTRMSGKHSINPDENENYLSYFELVKWMEEDKKISRYLPLVYADFASQKNENKHKYFYYRFKELLYKCYRNERLEDIKDFRIFINNSNSQLYMLQTLLLFSANNDEILNIQSEIQKVYMESLALKK